MLHKHESKERERHENSITEKIAVRAVPKVR